MLVVEAMANEECNARMINWVNVPTKDERGRPAVLLEYKYIQSVRQCHCTIWLFSSKLAC